MSKRVTTYWVRLANADDAVRLMLNHLRDITECSLISGQSYDEALTTNYDIIVIVMDNDEKDIEAIEYALENDPLVLHYSRSA